LKDWKFQTQALATAAFDRAREKDQRCLRCASYQTEADVRAVAAGNARVAVSGAGIFGFLAAVAGAQHPRIPDTPVHSEIRAVSPPWIRAPDVSPIKPMPSDRLHRLKLSKAPQNSPTRQRGQVGRREPFIHGRPAQGTTSLQSAPKPSVQENNAPRGRRFARRIPDSARMPRVRP
jgi:hypothetical protein